MAKRAYSSPRRAAEAARTRELILDATATLCARDGYLATTLKAIAAEAGVSVQSVTAAGTKAVLLIAAFERAFSGTEGRESLADRPDVRAIMQRPDTELALDQYLDYVADANSRTSGIVRAMEAAAQLDEAAAAALADLEGRRRSDMGLAARWFAQRGLIDPADIPRIADELGYVVGGEAYAYFVGLRGWTAADYRAWLARAVSSIRTDR
ncbi:TetR/AcrR family transcriptional regulator [Herbiconiux flava]|uniref:AcrR family transcriptional regulator n=1 Tax=Herbiconiux flava TaxID=881268 RepID=A0A852SMV9_9MICO|nr:TetR family transcriptional regulator [Herbiconiux flava]NYD70158.1 AcrR family transcriptional regulator [Herbiconiux flava]GLK16910.1 DNA-binding protein [Herbiconiux flava]